MEIFINRVWATLASAMGTTDTIMTLGAGQGARLGTIPSGDYIRFVILDGSMNVTEVVYVTAISGDAATVTRGQDGTSATTHQVGDRIEARVGKSTMDLLRDGNAAVNYLAADAVSASQVVNLGQLQAAMPAGTLISFAGTTAPAGYLQCPTSVTNISRTTYANLFAAIGTTWGAGDGSTTFGMPWFPAGYTMLHGVTGIGASTTGDNITHTHTDSGHNHTQAAHTHTDTGHNHTQAAHTHTDTGHNHSQATHTHTDTGHNHTQTSHSHTDSGHAHSIGVTVQTVQAPTGGGGIWSGIFTGKYWFIICQSFLNCANHC